MAWIVQGQMSSVKKDSHFLSFDNIHVTENSTVFFFVPVNESMTLYNSNFYLLVNFNDK